MPPTKQRSDSEVIQEVVSGRVDAFEELFQKYIALVAREVWNFFPRAHFVPDICQEVFIRALNSLSQLREPQRFKVWLMRIAHNMCITTLEANQRRMSQESSLDAMATIDICGVAPDVECASQDRFSGVLASLPPRDRLLLWMKYVEGLSYSDLAMITGDSETILRKRASRCLISLRERLK